jgi:hypothetical protein
LAILILVLEGDGGTAFLSQMSKHRVLGLKPHLRPEWRGQDGQDETQQPGHFRQLRWFRHINSPDGFLVHTIR